MFVCLRLYELTYFVEIVQKIDLCVQINKRQIFEAVLKFPGCAKGKTTHTFVCPLHTYIHKSTCICIEYLETA